MKLLELAGLVSCPFEYAGEQALTGRGERHALAYWARLADGLKRAGRLDLLRHGISYKEGALRVAREYGLVGLPPVRQFSLEIGEVVADDNGTRWVVRRRFRRTGRPYYQLESPGWRWTDAEEAVLSHARREAVRVDQDKDAMPMSRGA